MMSQWQQHVLPEELKMKQPVRVAVTGAAGQIGRPAVPDSCHGMTSR